MHRKAETLMSQKHPVPALFNHLGMPSVNRNDEFSITYKDGMLEASVKRKSGKVETIIQTVGSGGFNQMSNFNPDEMDIEQRNELIKKLYKNGRGESQPTIAKKFGLRQPQISRIINNQN